MAPQIFEPSAASDDSKKEPKFTTDKSSKDQLSEGKAVRDLLFRLELVKEWVSKILQDIRLCFYHIFKVKNKKYIFGTFIFKVIEAAQRRPVGQKLIFWVWKKKFLNIHFYPWV